MALRSQRASRQAPTLPGVWAWFAEQGWQPHAYQQEVWDAMATGHSGLLHATTGSGKTYAVWLGALARGHDLLQGAAKNGAVCAPDLQAQGTLQVLWLTPMRALAGLLAGRCGRTRCRAQSAPGARPTGQAVAHRHLAAS